MPDDSPKQRFRAAPQKLLFFSLDEIVEENGQTVEKNLQSSTLLNTKRTFPIPFVLNIDLLARRAVEFVVGQQIVVRDEFFVVDLEFWFVFEFFVAHQDSERVGGRGI